MDNWDKRKPPPSSENGAPDDATSDDTPFALAGEGPHGFVLAALNPAARAARLRAGQRLADARAICPGLLVEPADPSGDAATLQRLALWVQRWSPWTAVDGADGLLIDVTGAAHLFGGEAALIRDMARRLRRGGWRTRIAVSPTVGASWALARHAPRAFSIADPDDVTEKLDPLPVRSLRLDAGAVLLLERLGLKSIGQLRAVPRLALARRFAKDAIAANPLLRLDQALGRLDEPIAPARVDPPVRVVRRVTDPIVDLDLLTHLLGGMAAEFCETLETRGLGARRVRLDAFRTDGGVQSVPVETARATRSPGHLLRLFDGKLDRLDAGFGFDAAVLTAVRHERLDASQAHILDAESGDALLACLVDRLSAKFGTDRVRRPVAVQSHIPERSVAWRPALATSPPPTPRPRRKRPIRLLDRAEEISVLYATPEGLPRRFIWRRLSHLVARVEGPERIAPEWWREKSTVRLRDYYRVEDEAGRRYWLYRDGVDGDGRGGLPLWYLHGLFA